MRGREGGREGGRGTDRVVCSLHNEEIPLVHLGKDGRTDGIDGGRGGGMMMERRNGRGRMRAELDG